MRVLLLCPDFPPVLKSGARLFMELAQDLSDSGHQVTVLTLVPSISLARGEKDATRGFAKKESMGNIQVRRIKGLPISRRLPVARALDQLWLAFVFFVRGFGLPRQEAIIVYSPPLPLGLTGYMLARRWHGVVIINVQDLYPKSVIDLGLLRNPLLIRLSSALERFLYKRANAITVHSEGNREYVVARGAPPQRVLVVPNWVDLESLRPGPRINEWRTTQGLDNAFVVSFAGNMGFAQGLEDVLQVAERLQDRRDMTFVLAGDGALREPLQNMALGNGLKNVRFLPPQAGQAYTELLQASDVCLVALHKDLKTPVVPGKLQSIMAAGRPVVCWANPASDAKRIIEAAGCGLFVPAGDAEGLSKAILDVYHDRELGESMGQRGRRYAEQHFERKRCTGAYVALVEETRPRQKAKVKR